MGSQVVLAVVCCWALIGAPLARAETVTLGTLLEEMTDAERLTRVAERPYRLFQASSYDRLTSVPGSADWFANTDWNQWLRSETVDGRTEYVLLDTDGPGVIVRFWATILNVSNVLRIYLDGASTPVAQGTLTELVGRSGLIDSPLSFLAPAVDAPNVGHNLYLPIPFAGHCKITVESPVDRVYYNIEYRLYEPGTPVETFSEKALAVYSNALTCVAQRLQARHPFVAAADPCRQITCRLRPGGKGCETVFEGTAAVRKLRLKLRAADMPQALRSTSLEVDADGEQNAVRVPVGDFFCTGYVTTNSCTWMSEAFADGTLEAYWVMPFMGRAAIRLVNHGAQPVDVEKFEIWTRPYDWRSDSMHFHAAWREYPMQERVSLKGEDLCYVDLEGKGRLVGDSLAVFNGAGTATPMAWQNWWGEGDEKIYVDGESFPSHLGTGTEDYYGYAHCRPQAFSTPFVAQPVGDGNAKAGCTVNARLRLLDDITYSTGLRFDMELLPARTGNIRFAPTVFWYASPGGLCRNPNPVAAMQLPVARGETSGLEAVTNGCPIGLRRNMETLSISRNTAGATSCVTSNTLGLSGESCVVWRDVAAGDSLEFVVSAAFAGDCSLMLHVLSGPSLGKITVRVNGNAAAEEVSLFAPSAGVMAIDLGRHRLNAGENTLAVEVSSLPEEGASGTVAFDCLEDAGPYDVFAIFQMNKGGFGTSIQVSWNSHDAL